MNMYNLLDTRLAGVSRPPVGSARVGRVREVKTRLKLFIECCERFREVGRYKRFEMGRSDDLSGRFRV